MGQFFKNGAFLGIFCLLGFFAGCGSMISLLVPEISPCDGFCDVHERTDGEELGILGG